MATQPAYSDHAAAGSILHRIGLLGESTSSKIDPSDAGDPVSTKAQRRARKRLLNEVRAFLIDHDLDITPGTLSAAYEVCAGLNPALNRAILTRRANCLPITSEWLEEISADESGTNEKAVNALADRLEHGIDALSRATSTARQATSKYSDELERRVDDLVGEQDTSEVINGLADFAKAMLARSRETEAELRASERETARLRENLDRARREAEIDYLTGLPNRRAFEDVLKTEHAGASQDDKPLSVAFCDIDLFKAINDSHGHEAGDRIIRVVAQTLSDLCGDNCFIARHGGEEFVILFRGIAPVDALSMLDSARGELAQRRMINRRTDKPFGVVTFSGGIADVSQFADPREALVAADEALYRAKAGGRNRICLAGDEED